MELFPLKIQALIYYVTYEALKEFVENGLATPDECELYESVRYIFESQV